LRRRPRHGVHARAAPPSPPIRTANPFGRAPAHSKLLAPALHLLHTGSHVAFSGAAAATCFTPHVFRVRRPLFAVCGRAGLLARRQSTGVAPALHLLYTCFTPALRQVAQRDAPPRPVDAGPAATGLQLHPPHAPGPAGRRQVLVKQRSNTGQTRVKHWSNTGQILRVAASHH
jgi:hypothetical protein